MTGKEASDFKKVVYSSYSFFYLTGIMGNYLLSSVLIILLNFFVVSVGRFYPIVLGNSFKNYSIKT